ncbi:MAG TPA: S8 family serine peptidase [Anaerolineae bacterium]|nr:S8 family serine peptidase [Anaerolineae bacterium]
MTTPRRVLVEVRAPVVSRPAVAASIAMESGRKLPGFARDESFEAVPLRARGRPGVRVALGPADGGTLVLRGTLDPTAEAELKKRPEVIAIWSDPPIAPFQQVERMPMPREFLQVSPGVTQISAGGSSCSPADCTPTVPKGTLQAVAEYLGCPELWEKRITGVGVVIGICDTGVDRNVMPSLIDGWSPDPALPVGTDANGHGSMTSTDAVGIAIDAKVCDIGVLKTQDAQTAISNALTGFQWALDKYRGPLKYPHILSNSWGIFQQAWAPDYAANPNHPFTRKVREVIDAGVVVLFAAGNCGAVCADGRCGSDRGPGNSIWGANSLEPVITVGAANLNGEWAGYSSQGPGALFAQKPDIVAPAHFTGYYSCDAGTSAACPVAAGVVALLKNARFFEIKPADARRVLMESARDLCDPGWDAHTGHGMINAKAAYERLLATVPGEKG